MTIHAAANGRCGARHEPRQGPRRRLVYSCSFMGMAWVLVRRSPSVFSLSGENRRCRQKMHVRRSAGARLMSDGHSCKR